MAVLVSALGVGLAASAFAATTTSASSAKRMLRPRRAVPPLTVARPSVDIHQDAQGDSSNAADITEVDLGNDVLAGPIVIWVTFGNRTSWGADDRLIAAIDSDANAATGVEGVDYAIAFVAGDQCTSFRWDGSTFVAISAATLRCRFSSDDKSVRIEIQPSELGGTSSMSVGFATFKGEEEQGDDTPLFGYSLISGPLKLSVDDFAIVPRAPRAGGILAAAMSVSREDINQLVDSGTIACSLKLGSRSIRGSSQFVQGTPVCGWRLPAWTKGKRVRGSITLTFGGTSISKTFTVKVR
jgi:hypothetical protein